MILHAPPVEILKRATSRPDEPRATGCASSSSPTPTSSRSSRSPWACRPTARPRPAGSATSGSGVGATPDDTPEGMSRYGGRSRHEVTWRVTDDGEIQVRADRPGVLFEGYRKAGRLNRPFDEDGWFATGDLGRVDAAGNLVFIERRAESIRVKGEFVPIGYVEEQLRASSACSTTSPSGGGRATWSTTRWRSTWSATRSTSRRCRPERERLPGVHAPGRARAGEADPPRRRRRQDPSAPARRRRADRDDRADVSGIIDFHVHTSPSLVPRHHDDHEVGPLLAAAGIDTYVLKAHEGTTAERAQLAGDGAVGSIVLNSPVGGANPDAVLVAERLGARVVWMPTISSACHKARPAITGPRGPSRRRASGRCRSARGPSCAPSGSRSSTSWPSSDLILASGHLSMDETVEVFSRGPRAGRPAVPGEPPVAAVPRLAGRARRMPSSTSVPTSRWACWPTSSPTAAT